ncbi:MAG: lysophospholipid acyltransferase family protein [Nevskia sp.]|nr:lysophospholipid acyltransferase family protein [Nevskia sp.]
MRAIFRGARLILHLSTGMALVLLVTLDPSGRIAPEPLTRWWNARLLKILNVRLRVRGQRPQGPHLIVCNHISWLDIPVIAASELTRFVSKAEVGSWPIAGWLANAAGTFYIRRGAGGTKQLIQALASHLRDGGSATVFPEGTTTDGERMLKLQPRLFAAAIESDVPVLPIALRYSRAANGENIAAFVGEQTLTNNLLRLLKEPQLTVELTYCAPIRPQSGQDRAALAQGAHDAICAVVAPGSLPSTREAEEREWLAA